MAQELLVIGEANKSTGDNYFDAFTKIQNNFTELFSATTTTKQVLVNSIEDLPDPVVGVITLAASTKYLFTNSIDFGVNQLRYSSNTVVCGISALIVTLTYTGTSDFLIMSNVPSAVTDIKISAPNGRIFNWSDNASSVLRVVDTQMDCAKIGTFTGSNSQIRFTNSSTTCTTDGVEFFGTFASLLWEVAGANITTGTLFKLNSAQFFSFIIDKEIMTLGATATFLSGLTGSGNISTGGVGTIQTTRILGTGTVLSGISVDDALWEFINNDKIADTRPGSLLSMQSNSTNTVISTINTAVLVSGAWASQSMSQMTGTAAGRVTYVGTKGAKLPVTTVVSLEPVSGTNVKMSAYIAVNGVKVAASKGTGTASNGSPTSIAIPWQMTFNANDYVEVFIENNDNTTNILCSSAILRVN